MSLQRKANPPKVSNPAAAARAKVRKYKREEDERKRQRKIFERLKRK